MDKEQFRDRIKKSIDELFEVFDELDARKDELKEKSRARYNEIINEMKDWESKFESKQRQAKEGGDPHWEEAKQAFARSAGAFRDAMENLASFLRNSPPPPGPKGQNDSQNPL